MRLLSLIVLGALMAVPAIAQDAPPVTVAKPVVREVVEDDVFVGRFEPVDEVVVRARVSGYLEGVEFTDGAMVKKGDLLFVIDQRPFRLRLTQAQARLDDARALVELAEVQYERAEDLSERGNVPTSTLDARRQELLSGRAELTDATAALEQAKIDLEYTEIRAPLSGRIDRRYVSAGNLVRADDTVLTRIVSLDPIDFYFDIDERSFLAYARDARVRNSTLQEGAGGLEVSIRLAGEENDEPVIGTLNFAENRLDRETGTMRVRARVPNPDFVLYPGLFGRVSVPGSLPYEGILVPDEAVAADQDRRIVWVVDGNNVVHARPVRPGPRQYGYRVIREGLKGGETLVVNGLMRVRPGAKVAPTEIVLPPVAEGEPTE